MIPLLTKPHHEITAADIEELVESKVPEGERTEYKQALTGSSAKAWADTQRLTQEAKNQILEEVVAFANAYGGVLVLGIAESSTSPPVAQRAVPIPQCVELAKRFALVFRDRVEPQLPHLKIFGVPTEEGTDGGVVVFQTPRSRRAPHRITRTWLFPVRQMDSSERNMSMRRIREMVLSREQGMDHLNQRLRNRDARFREKLPENRWGLRITALPVGNDVQLDRVYNQASALVDGIGKPEVVLSRANPQLPISGANEVAECVKRGWAPIIRGAKTTRDDSPHRLTHTDACLELKCDGLVEFTWSHALLVQSPLSGDLYPYQLYTDTAVLQLANMLGWVEALRRHANAVLAEYVIDIAVHVSGENAVILPGNASISEMYRIGSGLGGYIKEPVTSLPQHWLVELADAPDLLTRFERDLSNAAGSAGIESQFTLEYVP